jgi:predicted transcriptional regulator
LNPPALSITSISKLPDLTEIRIHRERLGWTQRKLGQSCGLSQSFINKIERNEADPGYRTAKRIFQTLNLALSQTRSDNKTAIDVMASYIESVSTHQPIEEARKLMIKNNFSQLPVIDNGIVKGSITDKVLISLGQEQGQTKVGDVMRPKFPVVDPDTELETIRNLLQGYSAVLVDKGNKEYGIITKHDLLASVKLKK